MFKFRFAAVLVLGLILGAGSSRALVQEQLTDKVKVSLHTQYDAIQPRQNLGVLLKFKMTPGWHIFSQNPGEIGMPTKVEWQLPFGYEVDELGWSRDEEFKSDDIVQRGYGDTAYYQAVIRPDAQISGRAKLTAKVKWLACGEECVPEQKTFTVNLPVSQLEQLPTTVWNWELKNAEPWFLPEPEETARPNLWLIMLMAFAGGIIMNAMPCIFPILAIKAIALSQASYSKKKSRMEALFYTLGVVFSFVGIATVLMLLRINGEHIGWGFQLQSPWFVGGMAIVFILITLMLLDVIIVHNPLANKAGRMSFKNHLINSFMTGFLAVLIASPCTAPFMGVAIGYTLSAPVYTYYPVFLSLSLGYALPFALAGLFPKVIHRILPKPGKWMDVLKKIFAIPVFLTALWLLWVLYNQLAPQKNGTMAWKDYNPAKVSALVELKQPVFIDFTAKWCLTCLMNKRSTLESAEFAKLVKKHKLNLFRGDWTNNDQTVATALESYGRNSIPLYVYYNGKSADYEILPQILTPGIVKEYLKRN